MERGYRPEEILALSAEERNVWQAIAELNEQNRRQEMRDAVLEASDIILRAVFKK